MRLLFLCLLIGACAHERPACSPARLAAIEAAYVDEVVEACHGQAFETCSARPEIEARYALEREEWARCR